MDTTLAKLTTVFRNTFDDYNIVLTMDTNADDIDAWDSLMHVTLMTKVEKAFGVRFTSAQVASLTDVGELVELLDNLVRPS